MANEILTDVGSGYFATWSSNVQVFPTAYRDARSEDIPLDVESRLTTEYNFTQSIIGPNLNTYIKNWAAFNSTNPDDTPILELFISGYHFRIKGINKSALETNLGSSANIYAYIDLGDSQITTGQNTPILKNWYTKKAGVLDTEVIAGTSYFCGLVFSTNTPSSSDPENHWIQLTDENGNINSLAYYPIKVTKNSGLILNDINNNTASGKLALAEGYHTSASGNHSHAEGGAAKAEQGEIQLYTSANGDYSHAEGYATTASKTASHAEGLRTTASGQSTHAEGTGTTASGIASHAEGSGNGMDKGIASGDYSHSEGWLTTASETASHAEGYLTVASGSYSHAEGAYTNASSKSSHAEGDYTEASGDDYVVYSGGVHYARHAEGIWTSALAVGAHAEGIQTTASGQFSHAEGEYTKASDDRSHAEGYSTRALGEESHAEGINTTASKQAAHAEGSNTIASGIASHAEGSSTNASGEAAHAEGCYTTASGWYAHAEGYHTKAIRKSQHVFGEYNILDTTGSNISAKGQYIEIVGKGESDSNRSNARTLDWSGNETIDGEMSAKTFYARSDGRLKENIKPYHCEKSILDLPVVEFNFIGKEEKQIGCIAQDLQEICPEIVKEGTNGYLEINETKLVYLLLDEVKKLKKEIEELKK